MLLSCFLSKEKGSDEEEGSGEEENLLEKGNSNNRNNFSVCNVIKTYKKVH